VWKKGKESTTFVGNPPKKDSSWKSWLYMGSKMSLEERFRDGVDWINLA
jgi:hypothetical protein